MISVVIPLYNKECSISTALQSVLDQTFTDWECIVVDDGSTDNSYNVVKRVIEIESEGKKCSDEEEFRIRMIHQENAGVSAARNTGILAAKGEYVAFLDGDDRWDRNFLQKMVTLMEDFPGMSIYGLGCAQIKKDENIIINDNYYRGISLWDYSTMAFTGSSACVNKKDAIEVGLFDTRMTHGEDLDLWWRLMLLHGGASDLHPYAFYIQDAENRAMNRAVPIDKHIPYYIDKFALARAKDVDFRLFFDTEMVYRLYPYLFEQRSKKEARRLARKIDYSQLKWSMHFRMLFPHVYRLLTGR